MSLNDLVATIGNALSRPLQAHHEAPRPGDVRHSMADTMRARDERGYRVVVDSEEGLVRTVEHYSQSEGAHVARGRVNSGYPG